MVDPAFFTGRKRVESVRFGGAVGWQLAGSDGVEDGCKKELKK